MSPFPFPFSSPSDFSSIIRLTMAGTEATQEGFLWIYI